MKKKKGQSLSFIIFLIVLCYIFKSLPWLLIIVVIAAIVAFAVWSNKQFDDDPNSSKLSTKQDNNSNKNTASTGKALNYTPLTKAEINAKYNDVKQSAIVEQPAGNFAPTVKTRSGIVSTLGLYFDDMTIERLTNRYIAFDVETTGLNAQYNRIIEIGAVLFENCQPTKKFSSLVNSVSEVPHSATVINMITTDMVRAAPSESTVYAQLVDFLGDALNGKTIICAHNARFDMSFLSETLKRLGYDATISYVDTLSISRSMIINIENYKQPTIAKYFSIENEREHRADSDARVCGMILSKLLSIKLKEQEEIRQEQEKREQEERIRKEAFITLKNKCQQKRDSISINPINERVPLNEINNLNDSEKGYDEGYSFFCNGESYRKINDYESALKEYDIARHNGYCYPAIYRSYAMIFRKLKDYDNEISILDEAIQILQDDIRKCEQFLIRRDRAITLFIEQQEKAQIKADKQRELKERQSEQDAKTNLRRAVFQLSDDMTIIKEFNSVSEAAKSIGISEKVIRETAKGRQKHAGGFVWKYADEYDNVLPAAIQFDMLETKENDVYK